MRTCAACKEPITLSAICICGERYCSMSCAENATGHKRIKVVDASLPNIGGGFDAYFDPILGKHITSWRQQERELNRYNANPANKEKRSFFQDNHRAMVESANLRRHKHDIAREAYAREGKKYDPTRQGDPHREKNRRIYSFSR